MVSGMSRQGHGELCRRRMEDMFRATPEDQARVSRQQERESIKVARKIEVEDQQRARQKARGEEERGE